MDANYNRRTFLRTAGGAAVAGAASTKLLARESGTLIVGVSCSPRQGKTTAAAVKIALQAAQETDPRISTELIDLGGKKINGWTPPV